MPEISRFYGLVIAMFYNDHNPPHFHVRYGEYKATVRIDTATILDGELPRTASNLAKQWADLHREELQTNWTRARNHETLDAIAPLQ